MAKKSTKIKINCANCGEEKTIWKCRLRKNNFCNQKCRAKWLKSNPKNNNNWSKKIKIDCSNCGNPLERTKYKIGLYRDHYCNNKCRDEHRKKDKIAVICFNCGKEKEVLPSYFKNRKRFFCNNKCDKEYNKKENHPSWTGGDSVALYDRYYGLLSFCEDMRRNPDNYIQLQVRCLYCNQWYSPTKSDVQNRAQYVKGNVNSEGRFYCNSNCKASCSIFKQVLYPKGFKQATSREVQPQLRKMVLERDDWKCIKCGIGVEGRLHCHHLEGVEVNPLMSADIDNCITLCKTHHIEVHKQKDCGYYDLRKKAC